MSLTAITIAGVDYPSYATVAEADVFLAVDSGRREAWTALDPDTKHVNLAAATRRLDSLSWIGRKADDAQSTEWPRLDLTPAAPGLPSEVEQAAILLAGDLAVNPAALSTAPSDPDVQSERIGPYSTTYFYRRRQSAVLQALGGNRDALGLVRRWLSGAPVAAPVATGTGERSEFHPPGRYGRTEGMS